jgi:hypothetical protein
MFLEIQPCGCVKGKTKPAFERRLIRENRVREDRKVGMESADQAQEVICIQKVRAITRLLQDSEVPEVLQKYTNRYLGSLSASVLMDGDENERLIHVSANFGLVIRQQMPPQQFDSVLVYRIVRDLVAAFAIVFPQHVHQLIDGEMADSVKSRSGFYSRNLLDVPVYMQGAIAGIVKGLNKYREIVDGGIFELFQRVGEQVGAVFAETHCRHNLYGQILPQAESDIGREVVEMAKLRGNPFGFAFLSAFWGALGEIDRGALSVENGYALSRAIIRAFAIRHVASLNVQDIMWMIVPPEPVQPS